MLKYDGKSVYWYFLGSAAMSAGFTWILWMNSPLEMRTSALAFGCGMMAILGWAATVFLHAIATSLATQGNGLIARIKETFITQEIVDECLRKLAQKYDDVCSAQIVLQGRKVSGLALEEAKDDVLIARAVFWTANDLAADLDFKVKKKHHEHLSE